MKIDEYIEKARKHIPAEQYLTTGEILNICNNSEDHIDIAFKAFLIGYERRRRYEQRQRRENA